MLHRTLVPLFTIGVLLLSSTTLYAQKGERPRDSTIEARIDSAWAKVKRYGKQGRREKADSVQQAYADDFFRYYRKHPETETATKAAQSAFMMWSNTGSVREVEEAMTHLSRDSKLWSSILVVVGNAYARSEQKKQTDYVKLLQRLKGEFTHPWSKSEVRMELADHYMSEGKRQKAKKLYREVVNINAHPRYVEMATSNLYEMESLSVGQKAPTFEAATVRGDTVALSELRGNVVLLEFWATWCGPCKPEIPHLKSVWSKYRDEDFRLIGISLDESTDKLKKFVEKRAINWPQIQEEEKWDGEVPDLFNVSGIPRAYLIDRSGTIAAKDFRKEEIEKEVRQLMEGSEK